MTNNQIVAVKILNLEAQIAPLEDIVHEAQTMKVRWQLHGMTQRTNPQDFISRPCCRMLWLVVL